MITENKHRDNERKHEGLKNDVQQNRGMNSEHNDREPNNENNNEDKPGPVDNGGARSTDFDSRLEKQWLAVRDEYLANYPDLKDVDTDYEEGSFHTVIARLAENKKRSAEEIQNEILDWSSVNSAQQ